MTYETGLLRGNTGMYILNTRTSHKQASDDEDILIEHFEDVEGAEHCQIGLWALRVAIKISLHHPPASPTPGPIDEFSAVSQWNITVSSTLHSN